MKLTLSDNSRQLDVEIRCRNWAIAGVIAAVNETNPPVGYKLLSAITKRRRKTGRRANLSMRFGWFPQHANQIPATEQALLEVFAWDARVASVGQDSDEAGETRGGAHPD